MATASAKYEFADWINVTARAKMDRNNERRERMYDAGQILCLLLNTVITPRVISRINRYTVNYC